MCSGVKNGVRQGACWLLGLCWLALLPTWLNAAVLTYPGSGPCSNFSNCLAAANANDIVEIASNEPITGQLINSNKAVSIRPAPGFRPVFAPGVTLLISPQAGQGGLVRLEGLRLQGGSLVVSAFDPVQVDIINNQIDGFRTSSYSAGIWVIMPGLNASNNQLRLNIQGNVVHQDGGNNTSGIVAFRSEGTVDNPYELSITDNRVIARGSSQENGFGFGRSGIGVQDIGANQARLLIERNQVLEDPLIGDGSARLCGGISAASTQTARLPIRIANNLVVLKSNCGDLTSGIWINMHPASEITTAVLNNTIVSARTGIRIGSTGWDNPVQFRINGVLANNLIRNTPGAAVLIEPLVAGFSLSNHHNALFQAASHPSFVPGPNTLTVDPLSLPPRHRLASSSSLRDAGDLLAFQQALPNLSAALLDVDGLRRIKGNGIDIGAFEYGDTSYLIDIPGSNPSPLLLLDQPGLNGVAAAMLHLTRSDGRAADGYVGIANPLSSYYEVGSQRWHVRSENGNPLPAGGGLSVWSAAPGSTVMQYLVGLDSLSNPNAALLPEALASLPADVIFLVTPTRGVGNFGFVDTHPVAAKRISGQWHLSNMDGAPIDVGSAFVVYAQPPSHVAYVHTVSDANRISNTESRLDHPLLNGLACATVHVGVNGEGLMPARDVSAHYDATSGYWRLRLEEIGPMLFNNNRYNIVIDPKAVDDDCRVALLSDGFEGN